MNKYKNELLQFDPLIVVDRLREKDRKFQELVYRSYATEMFDISMSYLKNQEEVADVLQTSFLKVFQKIDQLDEPTSLGGWIRSIVVYTTLDKLKSLKRMTSLQFVEALPDLSEASAEFEDLDTFDDVMIQVEKLPEGAQIVLKLYYLEGLAHKEISEQLGISIGTSKSQLSRAKILLKTYLNQWYGAGI